MGCGKAFYHWSIIASIKVMNLNKYEGAHTLNKTNVRARWHMHAHTHSSLHTSCAAAPFLQIIFVKEWKFLRLSLFRLPAFPTLSALFPCFAISFHVQYSFLHVFSVSLSMPECKVRSTKGTPGTRMWSSFSNCHTTLLPLLPLSLLPSPVDSLFTEALARMANKAFSKRRKEEEEEVCPHHHLHLSLPSSLSQLAFHTPGSAIQTRSCMYMSLSANNTSLLTLPLPL